MSSRKKDNVLKSFFVIYSCIRKHNLTKLRLVCFLFTLYDMKYTIFVSFIAQTLKTKLFKLFSSTSQTDIYVKVFEKGNME